MSPRIQNYLFNHNCTIPFTRAYFLLELYTLLKSPQRSVAKNENKNMKKAFFYLQLPVLVLCTSSVHLHIFLLFKSLLCRQIKHSYYHQ